MSKKEQPEVQIEVETCLKGIEDYPCHKHHIYEKCDSLMDKLELLNYQEFLDDMRIPPFHRYYFATQKNPGEQFYIFTQLTAWILRRNGSYFPPPLETHDPNGIIAKIIDTTRHMDKDQKASYSTKQLKSGYGEDVVDLLEFIVDHALTLFNKRYEEPVLRNEDEYSDECLDEDDPEIIIEEDPGLAFFIDDDDDDDAVHVVLKNEKPNTRPNTAANSCSRNESQRPMTAKLISSRPQSSKLGIQKLISPSVAQEFHPEMMIPSMQYKGDLYNWRSECESIDIFLRNPPGEGPNEWESKFKNLETLTKKCMYVYEDLTKQLMRNLEVAERDMKEIESKESVVQTNYFPLIKKLIEVQNEVDTQKTQLNEARKEMSRKQEALETVTDQIKEVSKLIEERANYYTDRNPILGIKTDILALIKEIKDMDVENGIFERTILKHYVQVEEDFISQVWNIGKKPNKKD